MITVTAMVVVIMVEMMFTVVEEVVTVSMAVCGSIWGALGWHSDFPSDLTTSPLACLMSSRSSHLTLCLQPQMLALSHVLRRWLCGSAPCMSHAMSKCSLLYLPSRDLQSGREVTHCVSERLSSRGRWLCACC